MGAHDKIENEVFKAQVRELQQRKKHFAEATRRYDEGEITWDEYRREYEQLRH